MNISHENILNLYWGGDIKMEALYAEIFGTVPSTYYATFPIDRSLDTNVCDRNKVKDIIGNVFDKDYSIEIISKECRYEEKESSAVKEPKDPNHKVSTGDRIVKILRDSAYINGAYHQAEYIVIIYGLNLLVHISLDGVGLLYDSEKYTRDPEAVCTNLCNDLPTKDASESKLASIKFITYTNNEFVTVDSEINKTDVDIDKNYNDDFADAYAVLKDFLTTDKRMSGVAILHGEPGTGKTMLIRHLISNIKNDYIFVTPTVAAHLAAPEFIGFLQENQGSVFILEDCEQIIMDKSRSSFAGALSAILNLSDGIMSDAFNVKFICTYNGDTAHVDEALLRKGRCAVNYEFKPLSKDKVEKLLNERGIVLDKYTEMSLADLYFYGDDTCANKTRKIGF